MFSKTSHFLCFSLKEKYGKFLCYFYLIWFLTNMRRKILNLSKAGYYWIWPPILWGRKKSKIRDWNSNRWIIECCRQKLNAIVKVYISLSSRKSIKTATFVVYSFRHCIAYPGYFENVWSCNIGTILELFCSFPGPFSRW